MIANTILASYVDMLKSIGERDTALLPIGKTSETDEDSEDDDDVSVLRSCVFVKRPSKCLF